MDIIKKLIFLICLGLSSLILKAQSEKDLIILRVKNNKLELANAIRFLNTNSPKMICVNYDLFNCDNVQQFSSIHTDQSVEIHPSESEEKLSFVLAESKSLLLPSELRPFIDQKIMEIIGCSFLYLYSTPTGFINLISDQYDFNQVSKFQISNTFEDSFGTETSYHFAVKIALRLNEQAARKFIEVNPNITPINFEPIRKFKTYSIDDLYIDKEIIRSLKGKVIILSVDRPEEYRFVQSKLGKRRLSTSEIFAYIVCQMVE